MTKLLYTDTETTGLDPKAHSIIQLSGIIVVNGEEKQEFDFKMAPLPGAAISAEALKQQGRTLEEIREWPEPIEVYNKFLDILDKYINKFDRDDKFVPVGQNVRFDIDFLYAFFEAMGNKYFGSYVDAGAQIDILPVARFLRFAGVLKVPNCRLDTLCEHYGIVLDAHDSLNDIRASRELLRKMSKHFKKDGE